jgi:predicted MPP superfamily phosphohydrolase
MRLLHISDLHAREGAPAAQGLLVEKFLEDVRKQEQEGQIDLVLFSGDCAFDGSSQGLTVAKQLLLEPLATLLPDRPIVLVPGNHDVERGAIDRLQEQGMRDLFLTHEAIGELLGDESACTQALRRLQAWREFHAEFYREHPPVEIPLLGHIHTSSCDGISVGIAALNTAWRCSDDTDRGRLLVGEQQLRAAMSAISEQELGLVVMHHPLEWLAEFDETLCRQMFEEAHCFVFTGHDHKSNPAAMTTARGSAVYSRAGCLYESREYPNSYTLLELNRAGRSARARVRRWWLERDSFGVAEDLVEGGVVELPWPDSSAMLPAAAVPTERVLAPIAAIAKDESIIAPSLQGELTSIPELLIEPTFWPVPDDEARAAQELTEVTIEPVDAIPGLEAAGVTILSGSPSSGVTSALLWLLDTHFRAAGTRLPRYIRIDERISNGRLGQALLPPREGEERTAVPLLIAIDDVAPRDNRATQRLIRFIAAHPEAHFILGCHDSTHQTIVGEFPAAAEVERVFLRPLRRRDLRALVARVYGAESSELVRKVLAVLDSHRLPRNALNMAALVAVAAREPNLSEVNETGLFDAYVSLLLESELVYEPHIAGMDRRLREGLLERLAYELLSRKVSRLARADAEQFVIDFFKSVGWSSGSPARLLESFIVRRVLIEDELGVGFRYGALRDLFAAKWMLSSEAFAEEVRGDCLAYPDIIRHATGLRRNRPDILELVGETVRQAAEKFTLGVELARFDTTGQLALNPFPVGLQAGEAVNEEATPPPTEEELDDLYDGLASAPVEDDGEPRRIESGADAVPTTAIGQMYSLLAAVLKNSELVEDIDLKAKELREVIHGWSVLAMLITAESRAMTQLGDLLTPLLEELKSGEQETGDVANHFASMLILALLSVGLEGRVGTPRLEAALIQVLDDDEFMDTTLHALFATILYASLRLSGWAERVKTLYERHGRHSLVASLVTQWTLVRYRTDDLTDATRGVLEDVLADILVPSGSAEAAGPAAIVGRSRQRADVLQSLRRSRLLTQQRIKSLPEKDGTVDERESTGVIEQV